MGIRETLNQNPRLTTMGTAAIIVIALIFILWQIFGGDSGGIGTDTVKVYYSNDDGATYFAEDAKKIPPFDKDGKPAFRAHVYRCGKSGKPFVNHLERYTADAQKKLEEARSKGTSGAPTVMEDVYQTGVEIKKPGAKDWVKQSDPKAGQVIAPKCPSGSSGEIEMMQPE